MPPTRRHSRTTTPPVRRPKVAGLRRPGTPSPKHADPADATAPEVEQVPATEAEQAPPAEVEERPAEPEAGVDAPVETETEPAPDAPAVWDEPSDTEVAAKPVIGAPDVEETATEPAAAEPDAAEPVTEEEPEPASTVRKRVPTLRRPSGKSKATGTAQPDDLARAEAEAAVRPARFGPRRDNTFVWAIAFGVVAVILVGLAVWFRGEANSRSENVDVNNQALTDPGNQSEVVRQLRGAIEKAFSYNYTDLASTERAVQDNLAGKALCEHDALFGEVKKLAPEQKMVLTAQVVQIGVVRLEGERARLLVFLNQRSTRADQNQTVGAASQFAIDAERQGDKWKITNLDMLGQPRPDGKPLPQC